MIKGLYETHLFVEHLEKSINFYTTVLKLNSVALIKSVKRHFSG